MKTQPTNEEILDVYYAINIETPEISNQRQIELAAERLGLTLDKVVEALLEEAREEGKEEAESWRDFCFGICAGVVFLVLIIVLGAAIEKGW